MAVCVSAVCLYFIMRQCVCIGMHLVLCLYLLVHVCQCMCFSLSISMCMSVCNFSVYVGKSVYPSIVCWYV